MRAWKAAVAAVAIVGVVAMLTMPAIGSLFGEENVTLLEQLVQLLKIHDELVVVSEGVEKTADGVDDIVGMYNSARAGVKELQDYSIDGFLSDLRRDLYHLYPGSELLLEGANSSRVRKWKNSHSAKPFATYEMLGAVFGDLTEPLKEKGRSGELRTEGAYIVRAESAGALALAHDAEQWTQKADEDAREIAELARDADAAQAEHLSARALSLIAVQNSHIIRLLARGVRTDGIAGALDWGKRVRGLNRRAELRGGVKEALSEFSKPPKMVSMPGLFEEGE